jgi:hypothetical protein
MQLEVAFQHGNGLDVRTAVTMARKVSTHGVTLWSPFASPTLSRPIVYDPEVTVRVYVGFHFFAYLAEDKRFGLSQYICYEQLRMAPLRHPEYYQYELNLADDSRMDAWNRRHVLALRLGASAGQLAEFGGALGIMRRTLTDAANNARVPAHIFTGALFERLVSCRHHVFQGKLSAIRSGQELR